MMKFSVLGFFFMVPLLTKTSVGFEGESACENTCPTSESVSFGNKCHCDSNCAVVYNDCCYDSPYRLPMPPDNILEWQCHFVPGENRYFFVIGKCGDGWNGDKKVIEKCENESPFSSSAKDRERQGPITSITTKITYKNFYCAVCNDDMEEIVFWRSKAHCQVNQMILETTRNILEFNRLRRQWYLGKKESSSSKTLSYACEIIYQRPVDVSNGSVRECVPGLISTCPSSWRDLAIKKKCESYVNPVFWSKEESYRNIYCAICNNKGKNDYWCELYATVRSHADIFNIKCNGNETYDPVTKRCRRIICFKKGQVPKKGKCVEKKT